MQARDPAVGDPDRGWCCPSDEDLAVAGAKDHALIASDDQQVRNSPPRQTIALHRLNVNAARGLSKSLRGFAARAQCSYPLQSTAKASARAHKIAVQHAYRCASSGNQANVDATVQARR